LTYVEHKVIEEKGERKRDESGEGEEGPGK
jgi:hypothetical protein